MIAALHLEWLFGWPCTVEELDGSSKVITSVPPDQCYRFDPPERIQGVWMNAFEGSELLTTEEFATGVRYKENDATWLAMGDKFSGRYDKKNFGRAFKVVFVGRRASFPGAYGHMGMSRHLVLVDQLISLKPIEDTEMEVTAPH